jgi:hypothetical protein
MLIQIQCSQRVVSPIYYFHFVPQQNRLAGLSPSGAGQWKLGFCNQRWFMVSRTSLNQLHIALAVVSPYFDMSSTAFKVGLTSEASVIINTHCWPILWARWFSRAPVSFSQRHLQVFQSSP